MVIKHCIILYYILNIVKQKHRKSAKLFFYDRQTAREDVIWIVITIIIIIISIMIIISLISIISIIILIIIIFMFL